MRQKSTWREPSRDLDEIPRHQQPWRLRNWRLLPKLAAILLVPVLAIILLTWLRLGAEITNVTALGTAQQELELANQSVAVAAALQDERDAELAYIANGRASAPELDRTVRAHQVDTAVATLKASAGSLTQVDPAVRASVQAALADTDALTPLRAAVESTRYPDTAAFDRYTSMTASLIRVSESAATATVSRNSAIGPRLEALTALVDSQEQIAQQTAILLSAAYRGQFSPGQSTQLRAAQSRFDAEQTAFDRVASAADRQHFADVAAGPAVDGRTLVTQQALLQDATGHTIVVPPADVRRFGEDTTALVGKAAADLDREIGTTISGLSADARTSAWRDALVVAVVVLVALAVMVFVARSLLRPLNTLRRAALDLATNRLPAAIKRVLAGEESLAEAADVSPSVPVQTMDEVGQLARAFDAVHREAMRLAVQQAALRSSVNAMFVNLSRRSQNLVQRQLVVIERMEQDEQDPDQLADLFEVDHLATRMRRNSENLLVLAGTPVTSRETRAVSADDVFGAAVSEVEQYTRIEVAPTPDVLVVGQAARDVIHLLAELLENATEFSDPETKVTVRSITNRGAMMIEIQDRGVGMADDMIAKANARLAEPPEVDVAAASQMGLHVVGQLAKRHRIAVQLRGNVDIEGGITAKIVIPGTLIKPTPGSRIPESDSESPVPATADSGAAVAPSGVPEPATDSELAPSAAAGDVAAEPLGPSESPTERQAVATGPSAPPPPWPPPPEPSTPPAWTGARQQQDDDDAPETTRLLIYEEVISRWFQSEEEVESGNAESWALPIDERWRAAEATLSTQTTEPVTEAGLPKRVPKARLVPGSAAPKASRRQPDPESTPPPPTRPASMGLAAFARGADLGLEQMRDTGPIPVEEGS
ncbi:MAG: sensor histidine kinase [Kutzneria sp.]|nr:sensor histidine kinase [Kutzneria sp.]